MNALVVWFTGLSGSGKTTIARGAVAALERTGRRVRLLDGDAIRSSVHDDLGFTPDDIKENARRVVDLCRDGCDEYDYVFVTMISPFAESRRYVRRALEPRVVEIYINASVDECARRDVKGLYSKARQGAVENLIGVSPSTPYEPPSAPDLEIQTAQMTIDASVDLLIGFLATRPNAG